VFRLALRRCSEANWRNQGSPLARQRTRRARSDAPYRSTAVADGSIFLGARLRSGAPRLRKDRIKKPSTLTSKVLGSGDVLLSHGLSPYYHRGCSVSLPCSEWERVVPLRYSHQNSAPRFSAQNSGELTISDCRLQMCVYKTDTEVFKEHRLQIFQLKSAIFNC
jgi:hypothetical protein